MAKRRGHGEGGVYQRASDGLWVGSVELGYDGGKRRRKAVYGKSRAEAVKKVKEVQRTVDAGFTVSDERTTVGQYLNWWGTTVLPGTVKDSTADGYRWIIDHYVIPYIGRHKLTKLRAEHVQSMLSALESKGLSARAADF